MVQGEAQILTLFFGGDLMTGRGIDQVLPHPGDPRLQEPDVRSAHMYVELAYVWGDAVEELGQRAPDARIVNLETAVTRHDESWKGKEVHYRMHPDNVGCLTAARIDCCVLANNHALDYGRAGLLETLDTLERARVRIAGAGRHLADARAPAVILVPGKGRVIVFGFGTETSGIPRSWAATEDRPGLDLLMDLSDATLARIRDAVARVKRPRDILTPGRHRAELDVQLTIRESADDGIAPLDAGERAQCIGQVSVNTERKHDH